MMAVKQKTMAEKGINRQVRIFLAPRSNEASYRFHDLRHCAVTCMAMAGVPLTTVQQIPGHRDIKTTGYINPNDENRRKAVNELAVLFMKAGETSLEKPPSKDTQGLTQAAPTISASSN